MFLSQYSQISCIIMVDLVEVVFYLFFFLHFNIELSVTTSFRGSDNNTDKSFTWSLSDF